MFTNGQKEHEQRNAKRYAVSKDSDSFIKLLSSVLASFPLSFLSVVGDGRPSPFSKSARDIAPAAGHGLVLSSAGTGRRLDGGLRSVAEVAAAAFQAEKWEGKLRLLMLTQLSQS